MDTCCYKCKKKKMVLIACSCGFKFCLKHHTPTTHNCVRIFENKKEINETDYEPTGVFKKIDKL